MTPARTKSVSLARRIRRFAIFVSLCALLFATLPFSAAAARAGTPGAPASINLELVGDSDIEISWTPPTNRGSSAVSGYDIYVSRGRTALHTNSVSSAILLDANRRTYTYAGVKGARYTVKVSARNAAGTGQYEARRINTVPTVPSAPNLRGIGNGVPGYLFFEWSPPVHNGRSRITEYRATITNIGNGDTVTFLYDKWDTHADYYGTDGATYKVTLAARNSVGESASVSGQITTREECKLSWWERILRYECVY